MDNEYKKLLKDLEKETGITFSIEAISEDDETTKKCLRQMIRAQRSQQNVGAFLSSIFQGELSEDAIKHSLSRFHIKSSDEYILFLIKPSAKATELDALSAIVTNLFPLGSVICSSSSDSFILPVLWKIDSNFKKTDARTYATELLGIINTELLADVHISYTDTVRPVLEIKESYDEASKALEIGRIFHSEEYIHGYSQLDIGGLIYSLPKPVCEKYLAEVVGAVRLADFDNETQSVIKTYYETNLNLSETSQILFLHRNTVVYRLKKVEKATGLDLKKYHDAMRFQLALMIADALNYKN